MTALKEDLDFYRDQIGVASDRCRQVLYFFLVTTCVIGLFAYNDIGYDWGWKKDALDFRVHCVQYLESREATGHDPDGQADYWKDIEKKMNEDLANYPEVQTDCDKLKLVKTWRDTLADLKFKSIYVQGFTVPFLNTPMEINDAGILASFGQAALAGLFLFCMRRYFRNLKVGFQKACHKSTLREFLDQVETKLVLTPMPGPQKASRVDFATVLYTSPLALQAWVFVRDCCTANEGLIQSFWMTWLTLGVECAGLIVMGWVTFATYRTYVAAKEILTYYHVLSNSKDGSVQFVPWTSENMSQLLRPDA